MIAKIAALLTVLLLQPVTAVQPDLAREQRLTAQIVDAILDGEPVDLAADGHEFLGIYTETAGQASQGAVLILHGRGFHPDWVDLVQPLRVGLTEYGWNTLSIQLPVLEKSAKYNDYVEIFPAAAPRIDTAIDYLAAQGNERIVLLAHSCGAHMAQHWIHRGGPQASARIDAYIGIGMGATDYGQRMREPYALGKLRQPILDLYGEHDYPAVQRMAAERRRLMQIGGHPGSAQRVVPGADHYFEGKGDEAVEIIAAWLDTL